jgi:hypothetical protein
MASRSKACDVLFHSKVWIVGSKPIRRISVYSVTCISVTVDGVWIGDSIY